jgi:hypothetical protein
MKRSDLGWMIQSILHGTGWGCTLRIEAHFDESGTDAKEITLAGYLFEAERLEQFSLDWIALLDLHNLPYFHMVDLAHGNAPFEGLSKEARIRLQMKFMSLIKRYAINGIVCNIANIKNNSGTAYLSAVEGAVRLALEWADKASFDGKIGYFFEAGANGQSLVDARFQEIATDRVWVPAQRRKRRGPSRRPACLAIS